MTKNIIIVVLTIACILSLSFGYTQKKRADENLRLAEASEMIARQEAARAREFLVRAEQQAAAAEHFRIEYEKRLLESQSKPKGK